VPSFDERPFFLLSIACTNAGIAISLHQQNVKTDMHSFVDETTKYKDTIVIKKKYQNKNTPHR
jgi:thiamine phosphate synthase YjbQ (UPF0047 family)